MAKTTINAQTLMQLLQHRGAEIMRLTAENAKLRADLAEVEEEFGTLQNDLGKTLHENERLRTALWDIHTYAQLGVITIAMSWEQTADEWAGLVSRCKAIARAALTSDKEEGND